MRRLLQRFLNEPGMLIRKTFNIHLAHHDMSTLAHRHGSEGFDDGRRPLERRLRPMENTPSGNRKPPGSQTHLTDFARFPRRSDECQLAVGSSNITNAMHHLDKLLALPRLFGSAGRHINIRRDEYQFSEIDRFYCVFLTAPAQFIFKAVSLARDFPAIITPKIDVESEKWQTP